MSRVIFPAKRSEEQKPYSFDFLADLPPGITLANPNVIAEVYSGTDAGPFNILSGSPSVASSMVNQTLTGGVIGVTYKLTCTADRSNGESISGTLVRTAFLTIVPTVT